MLDDKDIELLEAYTYGEISPEAEAGLRERLTQDADFAASVRRWELLEREGFVAEPAAATRDAVMAALEKPTTQSTESPAGIPWWRYLLGLLLLGTIGFAVWALLVKPSLAPAAAPPTEMPTEPTETVEENIYADLVEEYFRHLPSENFHLGNAETLEERALAAYEARDYATALPLLLETVEMGGDSLNLLYAGVAALGSGDGESAIFFELLPIQLALDYEAEVNFYKGNSRLLKGDLDGALKYFSLISNTHIYANDAKSLIQFIKNQNR